MGKRRAVFALVLGLAAFAGSAALLARGVPFLQTWFYCFAWWPLVLILDAVNVLRTGVSPLASEPPGFAWTALVSIPVWLVFEAFNARLRNWSYHELPPSLAVRWLGYAAGEAALGWMNASAMLSANVAVDWASRTLTDPAVWVRTSVTPPRERVPIADPLPLSLATSTSLVPGTVRVTWTSWPASSWTEAVAFPPSGP